MFTGNEDEELTAAATSLHREWDSPRLWPDIAAQIEADERATPPRPHTRWRLLAAAAVLILAVGSTSWLAWYSLAPAPDADTQQRLLNEDALAAIERSEAQYVQAIDELTRLAAPRLEMPDSPMLVSLRERLATIDAAITEYRVEIARNRFNAHLRRQLLWIYQEKRRTLEQIQEYDPHAL